MSVEQHSFAIDVKIPQPPPPSREELLRKARERKLTLEQRKSFVSSDELRGSTVIVLDEDPVLLLQERFAREDEEIRLDELKRKEYFPASGGSLSQDNFFLRTPGTEVKMEPAATLKPKPVVTPLATFLNRLRLRFPRLSGQAISPAQKTSLAFGAGEQDYVRKNEMLKRKLQLGLAGPEGIFIENL